MQLGVCARKKMYNQVVGPMPKSAPLAELVYAPVLETGVERHKSSSLLWGTNTLIMWKALYSQEHSMLRVRVVVKRVDYSFYQ